MSAKNSKHVQYSVSIYSVIIFYKRSQSRAAHVVSYGVGVAVGGHFGTTQSLHWYTKQIDWINIYPFQNDKLRFVNYNQECMMTSFFIVEGGGRVCDFLFWPW